MHSGVMHSQRTTLGTVQLAHSKTTELNLRSGHNTQGGNNVLKCLFPTMGEC